MGQAIAREHFIPIRKADLLDLLCRQPGVSADQQGQFRQLCRLLESTFHFEFHAQLEQLKASYAPFDPDTDAPPLVPLSGEQEQQQMDGLFDKLTWLLERANFKRLSHDDILAALEGMTDFGLRLDVDFDVFRRLEVYARGDTFSTTTRRRLRNRFRLEEITLPIYQRLVMVFRLHKHKRLERHVDTQTVYIKLFKDIPKLDLEMLLPGTRVRMTYLDQAKVALPTVSGVALTGAKVVQGALTVATAGAYGMLAFLGVLAGTLGYGARSFFGYLNTKQKYQLSLTQKLYYLNLDNNAGVLFRLLDEGEEQECREAMLAWFFLWRQARDEGWTPEELDTAIETFLRQSVQFEVDFEIHDALDKLLRLKIVEQSPDGRLRALPIDAALTALDHAWDNFFQHNSKAPVVVAAESKPVAAGPKYRMSNTECRMSK